MINYTNNGELGPLRRTRIDSGRPVVDADDDDDDDVEGNQIGQKLFKEKKPHHSLLAKCVSRWRGRTVVSG